MERTEVRIEEMVKQLPPQLQREVEDFWRSGSGNRVASSPLRTSRSIYFGGTVAQISGMVGGLMVLVDTNLIVEILLQQTKAEQVKRFLEHPAPEDLYLTEFSLHSPGILLLRRKMHDSSGG